MARAQREGSYTEAIAAAICARVASGESVRTICDDESMPASSSVYKWLSEHDNFAEQYARAREAQADYYAEQIIQIADDGANDTYLDEDGKQRTDQDVIARSRLRVDARKWYASKLAPKKYGDKIEHSGTGEGGALVVEITRFGSQLAK
jgi:hypothetical protein